MDKVKWRLTWIHGGPDGLAMKTSTCFPDIDTALNYLLNKVSRQLVSSIKLERVGEED